MKKKRKLNIAIVGLGNIGINLYMHLIKNKKSIIAKNNINFEVKYVSAKNINKKRKIKIPKKKWLKNYLLASKLNDMGIKTFTNSTWKPMTVSRTLKYINT